MLWYWGAVVLGCCGIGVLWYWGTVLGCRGKPVLWSAGAAVLWSAKDATGLVRAESILARIAGE